MLEYKNKMLTLKNNNIFIALFLLSVLTGCSSTAQQQQEHSDPLESINRPIWTFNWQYLDKYVVEPASRNYVEYTPPVLRNGLFNIAKNLEEPATVINDLLQLKFADAAQSTGRFVLNSTVGIFGFFDPASDFGWLRKREEFGEVLGVYGVNDGAYIMLPALGPSSARDLTGLYVDQLYWPMAIIDFWPNVVRLTIKGLETRASLADQESLINDSLDSYTFIKNAYFQNMRYKVYDGNPPVEENTDEDDELESFMDEIDDGDQNN